jgi:hypothetical protein
MLVVVLQAGEAGAQAALLRAEDAVVLPGAAHEVEEEEEARLQSQVPVEVGEART